MDLYDFGFEEKNRNLCGEINKNCTFILHITCRFKVIWKTDPQKTDMFFEDTPVEEFYFKIKNVIGSSVRRVALSEKNDLWLDFGDCWIVFVTFENGEESWRFFSSDITFPHLVASNCWTYFCK